MLRDTAANGLSGAYLLASFYVNGATFLGFAVLAEKRGMQTRARGEKSLYFTAGLLEEFARSGFLNVAGGCCGTTPEHIAAIAQAVSPYKPRCCGAFGLPRAA